MIIDLQPYPKYYAVDLPWLDSLPEHWTIERGKNFIHSIDIRSETGEEELLTVSSERGVVPRKSIQVTMFKAESYKGYKLCWPGDLVINSLWAWAGGLGISKYHGIISSAYGVYRIRDCSKCNPDYIHELVRSKPFHWELFVRSKGIWTSRLQLTDDAFLNTPFPLPPLAEQEAIVRFLDYASSRINRYIRNKRKLIKLLEEQKQAIIHQAITKGLNPEYPMKESGVEWLGEIPAHWEVRRVRNLVDMRVSNVDKHISDHEHSVQLCNYIDVYKNDKITHYLIFMHATATEDEISRFRLKIGDVIITKDSETWNDIGVPALVTYTEPNLICGYHLALLRPDGTSLNGQFLFRALQSAGVQYQFHISANGVTRYGLSHDAIKSIWIPIPPIDEQELIARFLEEKLGMIDKIISITKDELTILPEYKRNLVAAIVTGKLDVSDVVKMNHFIPDDIWMDEDEDDELNSEVIIEENQG